MTTGILLLLVAIIISGFIALYLFFRSDLRDLRQSLDSTKDTVNSSLAINTADISNRLMHASQVIGELKREAGAFSEVSRSMQELHDFLRSPKLRGNIGEAVLKDLISQMFPRSSYHLQYTFKSGEKVDAAIMTDAGILPVDSKFPMENFQKMSKAHDKKEEESFRKSFFRDIRKHIDDISSKYILPEENTLDFALMYIPSESVYYEVMNELAVADYSRSRRVYPVSPTTMYAAIQTILLSFEGKKIESKAKEVFKLLRAIEKDYAKTGDTLATLGSHINNAYNKYSEVNTSFDRLGQKLSSTKEFSPSVEEDNLIGK